MYQAEITANSVQNLLGLNATSVIVNGDVVTVTIPQRYNNSNWYKAMLRRAGYNFTFSKTSDSFVFTINQ